MASRRATSRALCSSSGSPRLDTVRALAHTPSYQLLRSAVLFKLCSYEGLVRGVVRILTAEGGGVGGAGAGVRAALSSAVRSIVFGSFAAGEELNDCLLLASKLRTQYGITAIVDHSMEELLGERAFAGALQQKIELLLCLREEAAQGTVRFVPLKATSLVDAGALESLTALLVRGGGDEEAALRSMDGAVRSELSSGIARLGDLCKCAADCGVGLLLDAEESHRQAAICLIFNALAARHNLPGRSPVLYNTYQLYLQASMASLQRDMQRARLGGYVFAAKLVRGAYMGSEQRRGAGGIYTSKAATDAAYDKAVAETLSSVGQGDDTWLVIATHNSRSVEAAIEAMARAGLKNSDERVAFAQILGMADPLSQALGLQGYNVSKLLCYGRYGQLLPWLLRRLDENQSALNATQTDRGVITLELRRRFLGRGWG